MSRTLQQIHSQREEVVKHRSSLPILRNILVILQARIYLQHNDDGCRC